MRSLVLGVAVLVAVAVAPAEASAALTATGIRVADHPGFVRVVVDFSGGRVVTGEVVASDPDPFRDGVVRLPLTRRGVRSTAAPVTARGVRARIGGRRGRIVIHLRGAARRFKYAGYRALRGPDRLVVDLFKSAPPVAGAEVRRAPDRCLALTRAAIGGRRAPDRCLALTRAAIGGRRVRASGRERDLFEHSLVVRLRRTDGRIHAQRAATAANGRWAVRFRFRRAARQAGTLEAVALSAKDGTLECLVQVRVRFGG